MGAAPAARMLMKVSTASSGCRTGTSITGVWLMFSWASRAATFAWSADRERVGSSWSTSANVNADRLFVIGLPAAAVWSAMQAANSAPFSSICADARSFWAGTLLGVCAGSRNCLATAPVSPVADLPKNLKLVTWCRSCASERAWSASGWKTFARATAAPPGGKKTLSIPPEWQASSTAVNTSGGNAAERATNSVSSRKPS